MKKIVIVGVGALGSHAALFLRNLDTFKLVVIDFDRVETKNTLAQFHGKTTVGKNKTVGLQQSLNYLFGVKIDAVPHKLNEHNAQALLGGAALVLDCLDNGDSRRVVQKFVRELKVPCVHGALAADGTIGRVVWDEKFRIDQETEGVGATCENGEHLPFIALVAAQLARSAHEYLTGGAQLSYQILSKSASIRL